MRKKQSDYRNSGRERKRKNLKFKDFYDEEFDEMDKKEFYRRKKKLGKKRKEIQHTGSDNTAVFTDHHGNDN